MKSHFFVFLKDFKNKKELVQLFWKTHQKYITKWYLNQKQNTDVIISASPEFLLKPLEKKLKIKKVIATKVDQNGVLQSKNCEKEEKVSRFYTSFPRQTVNCFYSDSVTDQPMADIAKYAYLVNHKKKQILNWRKKNEEHNETL